MSTDEKPFVSNLDPGDNWESGPTVDDYDPPDFAPLELNPFVRARRRRLANAKTAKPFNRLDRIGELRSRGWCTGPLEGVPPPGAVDAGKRAACTKCGKRVAVTVRGRFAHHKPKKARK